jgi:hypothetical protein
MADKKNGRGELMDELEYLVKYTSHRLATLAPETILNKPNNEKIKETSDSINDAIAKAHSSILGLFEGWLPDRVKNSQNVYIKSIVEQFGGGNQDPNSYARGFQLGWNNCLIKIKQNIQGEKGENQ